jgi:hypothetical protein
VTDPNDKNEVHALRKAIYEHNRQILSVRQCKALLGDGFKGLVGELAAENAELHAQLHELTEALNDRLR